jgi:hypothetical protein
MSGISASRLGFWSAILTAVLAAAFFALGIATPARSGPFAPPASAIQYPYTNGIATFIPGDYVWLYPGILLAPIFVVLMGSINSYARQDRRIFSQIGVSFAIGYAVLIMADYFIQFTVVIPGIQSGETAGLSLFTQYNPHGLFIGLEGLGYLLMSMALAFTAAVFSEGRLQSAIRWLFVASFVVGVISFAVFSLLRFDIVAFEVTILLTNWIVLIASGALLSLLFRRAAKSMTEKMALPLVTMQKQGEEAADRARDTSRG